jgi:DNA-3-methyladenine glycosylase
MKLPLSFYQRDDVVQISKDLLGKYLYTHSAEGITVGMIVETEAYAGITDKASHAYGGRFTPRTQIMYEAGGVAYIYLIYGFHFLFNIVTHIKGIPHAVLVRAIEPVEGIEIMLERRKMAKLNPKLTSGPGVLSKAMGINKDNNGNSLIDDQIWLEHRGISIAEEDILTSPRVNVAYAAEDALLPWRFRIKNNPYTSPAK